jgi:hypothetical protein
MVMMPDGRIVTIRGATAFTDEPFVPVSADALAERLGREEFAGFVETRTPHYLVYSKASAGFTKASANLLESLYVGLLEQFRKKEIPVHEAEFPLVAVIFGSETDFRAHAPVPDDVQAYYNVLSNRIVMFETAERGREGSDVEARRRPQTVAHEGTHQILQNTGIQPRLASWPLWLIEGLAEYFAPTTVGRDGRWDGANRVNPFHMATLRDLQDPQTFEERVAAGARQQGTKIGGPSAGMSTVEYLVTRKALTPTDYALSWALTHYLANRRFPALLSYLDDLSHREPLQTASPEEHLADFRRHFTDDLRKLDPQINKYLAGLKGYEALPYFAVTFEQIMGGGIVRRSVLVSQSPATIRQWVDEMSRPEGGSVAWHATPFLYQAQAMQMAERWLGGP